MGAPQQERWVKLAVGGDGKGDSSRSLNGVGDIWMSREEEAAETMYIYFQLTPLMKAVDLFSLVPLSTGHL